MSSSDICMSQMAVTGSTILWGCALVWRLPLDTFRKYWTAVVVFNLELKLLFSIVVHRKIFRRKDRPLLKFPLPLYCKKDHMVFESEELARWWRLQFWFWVLWKYYLWTEWCLGCLFHFSCINQLATSQSNRGKWIMFLIKRS